MNKNGRNKRRAHRAHTHRRRLQCRLEWQCCCISTYLCATQTHYRIPFLIFGNDDDGGNDDMAGNRRRRCKMTSCRVRFPGASSGKAVSTKILRTTQKIISYRCSLDDRKVLPLADAIDEKTLKIIIFFLSLHSLAHFDCLARTHTMRLWLFQQRKRKKIL